MKKEWYVIEKKFHRGPYSFSDLKKFLKEGKVNHGTSVWKEGMDKPSLFSELLHIEKKLEETLIPDIPSDQLKNELPPIPVLLNLPGNNPLEGIDESIFNTKPDQIPNFDLPKLQKKKLSKIVGVYLLILFLIAALTTGLLFYFFVFKTPELKYSQGIKKEDQKRLGQIIQHRKELKTYYDFAYSADLNKVVVAINFPFTTYLKIEMESIPEKTTEFKKITAISEAELIKFLVEFDKFKFIDGHRLLPGFYKIKIVPLSAPSKNIISSWQYEQSELNPIETEIYIGAGTADEFLIKIKKEREELEERLEKENHEIVSLRDKEEKFRTLLSLLDSVVQNVSAYFNKFNKANSTNKDFIKKATKTLEKQFLAEVSPLLTSIGMQDETNIAKKIGELFVNILDKTPKLLKNEAKFNDYSRDTQISLKEFQADLEEKIKVLEENISKKKAQLLKF